MEKHGPITPYCLIDTTPEAGLLSTSTGIIVDIICIAKLWICGGALSTVQLGLQPDENQNVLLRGWQSAVGDSIKSLPAGMLLGGIALCTLGYSTSCMYAYSRARSRSTIAAAACIVLVLIDSLPNGLKVGPLERLMIILPIAVNAGLTWALFTSRPGAKPVATSTV